MPESPLIDSGITQGAVIDCSALSAEVRQCVQENRAIADRRRKPVTPDRRLIVLSQDCDIVSSGQQNIEVLATKVKRHLPASGSHLSRPRDYSKLYLPYDGLYLECQAELISTIPKSQLEGVNPEGLLPTVSRKSRQILLDWRVGTYRREPLPDRFNRPLFAFLHDEQVGFSDFLEDHYEDISDVFVMVFPEDEGAQQYDVSMTFVLSETCPEGFASTVETELREFLTRLDENENSLNFVQLDGREWTHPVPDVTLDLVATAEDISLLDINRMKRLNTDFLCYPDDDEA